MKVLIATLLSVGIACSNIINIDDKVDSELDSFNLFNTYNNDTMIHIPGDTINENVSYTDGWLTSWGTLYRTDHCLQYTSQDNQCISYDLHLGLKFFAMLFGKILIRSRDTAAYFQVDDNSVHLGLTYTNQNVCTAALYALAVERFRQVKVSVSNHKFNEFDFESFFQREVQNKMNWILATYTPHIQSFFQKTLCSKGSNGDIPSIRTILILIQKIFTDLFK